VRVAVTGAAGRLGARAVALLAGQGHSVVAIDRSVPGGSADDPRTDWRLADLTDYRSVLGAFDGCDAVVHLSALVGLGHAPEPEIHHNNVVGSYNALHAAASLGIRRICQASSVNAVGGAYSRSPRFDYFPIDEAHPSYTEDAYSLSKWICEQQAASIARRHDGLPIASLRFHMCVEDRDRAAEAVRAHPGTAVKDLWGYVSLASAAGACLLAIGAGHGSHQRAGHDGHEAFLVVAPEHVGTGTAADLAAEHYPSVPLKSAMGPRDGFFNCAKAQRLLGWRHDEW
jgi:UDP-glucose 4-epimerase